MDEKQIEDMFAALESQPYRLANILATAAKKLDSSEAVGRNAKQTFSSIVVALDDILKIRADAGAEAKTIDGRIQSLVAEIGAMKPMLTAERKAILDPLLATLGYAPKV